MFPFAAGPVTRVYFPDGLCVSAVRLVQVMVPVGSREAVRDVLEAEEIDYVLTDETSDREFTAVVYFPLPPQAVEPVLDELRSAIGDDQSYTVVVDAETVVSRRFEELKQRYDEEEEGDRVARQELRARAEDLAPDVSMYVALTVVSVVVATAGVLLDDAAVVVGSMVIAPLIGPAMATAAGSVLDEGDLFRRGVRLQLIGALVAVTTATVFAVLVKETYLVPPGLEIGLIDQVRGRIAPGVLSLVVALGAGVAGALSLSAAVSAAIVGVAIAVALIPPVAVIGIGVAWGRPLMAAGATILVLVNFLSINAAAMATLWYKGYRPGHWFRLPEARTATLRRLAILVAGILLLSLFLGGVTFTSYQAATVEQRASEAARSAVPEGSLSVRSVSVTFAERFPTPEPETVVVRIGLPRDTQPPPDLADTIATAVEDRTGRSIAVRVEYVTIEESPATAVDNHRSLDGLQGAVPT
jgi:uncharacterized hydrophobic protein (TIGR00341 family)